ncbi:hypothetical protein BTI_4042 [Burkholderia thailandensis MSMB121]|nr:hypothetical protein BTI_4042 [Burkholderia thailandensis MSMB121]
MNESSIVPSRLPPTPAACAPRKANHAGPASRNALPPLPPLLRRSGGDTPLRRRHRRNGEPGIRNHRRRAGRAALMARHVTASAMIASSVVPRIVRRAPAPPNRRGWAQLRPSRTAKISGTPPPASSAATPQPACPRACVLDASARRHARRRAPSRPPPVSPPRRSSAPPRPSRRPGCRAPCTRPSPASPHTRRCRPPRRRAARPRSGTASG